MALPAAPESSVLEFEDGETTIRRTVLECGTRVVTQHIPAVRSAGVSFVVPVGSRDESPRHAGSTHFLEHLLFKGTPTRSALDIAVAFDSVGGESNAETGKETTSYWARVVDEDARMAVQVLADMVADSVIDPREFETERGVILDELAMAEDSPSDLVHDAFQLAVHGDVPLGRPVGGTPDAIRAVTREDVWEHYRASYGPDSLVVAAAGNVEHDKVVDTVAEALAESTWAERAAGAAPPRPRRPIDATHGPGVTEIVRHRDVEQAHVVLGCPSMRADDERRPVMSVLLSVLGGSMSSRLFQEIREKRGLAYTTYAFDAAYSDAGAFGMYAGTSPSRVEEVSSLMVAQLEELAANGPTEEEIARVRGQVRGSLALAMESTWSRMMRLGRAEIQGKYRTVDHLMRRIESVEASQVQALAAELAGGPHARALVLPTATA
ncbi:insulinase family protein [Schaalia sp. 19OD2882]|nr:insulinase family protein [Schaalia sp. 19OD2882]